MSNMVVFPTSGRTVPNAILLRILGKESAAMNQSSEPAMSKARKKRYTYDYPRPAVTVDIIVVTKERKPRVLLIRRKHEPFAGMWAIPGGFVDMEEGLKDAAKRELKEETSLELDDLEQLQTFGDPDRDPRGRVIAVAYLIRVDFKKVQPRAGDDAAAAAWHSLAAPPPLAFDHALILEAARRRLREQKKPTRARTKKPS
jgi:8-oxo-dGTP diphosphatase